MIMNFKKYIMATFNFGGDSVFVGNNITIRNSRVIIDGKDVTPDSKEINITITGDVNEISADVVEKITVNGNVTNSVKTTNGGIDVTGTVGGDVKTTNGNVDCGDVNGSVKTTNGNIKHKKS